MISIEEHYRVSLHIKDSKIVKYLDTKIDIKFNFKGHALSEKSTPKLYVIKDESDFLYVGTTFQALTSRLRYGFYADGKRGGYYGYHWKNKEVVQMHVWCFAGIDKKHLEGIEAELVFRIRT